MNKKLVAMILGVGLGLGSVSTSVLASQQQCWDNYWQCNSGQSPGKYCYRDLQLCLYYTP